MPISEAAEGTSQMTEVRQLGLTSRILVASALFIGIASPSNAAPVTFAQYVQKNGATEQWTVSTAGTTTTVSASGPIYFSFSGVPDAPFAGPEVATFTLTATSGQIGNCGVSCGAGDSFEQFGYSGTFSIIDNGADAGADLLSGIFAVTASPSTTGAQFSSNIGSSGGSFNASATLGNLNQLVLTSQFLNFANETDENASWSLSSLIPNFATTTVVADQAYPAATPFIAAATATFSSNAVPPVMIAEPSSLALLGGGVFGLALLLNRKPSESRRPARRYSSAGSA